VVPRASACSEDRNAWIDRIVGEVLQLNWRDRQQPG
jgi:hypothetical protein